MQSLDVPNDVAPRVTPKGYQSLAISSVPEDERSLRSKYEDTPITGTATPRMRRINFSHVRVRIICMIARSLSLALSGTEFVSSRFYEESDAVYL